MSWKLFIDDERDIGTTWEGDKWFIARDFDDACFLVIKHGLPSFISFDHDLGFGPTGADFAEWLVNHILDREIKFPNNFDYYVHSQNPIGAANIRGKMDAAINHLGYDD